jgi:hypothetical protein
MLTAAAGAAVLFLGGLLAVVGGAYISDGLVMLVPAALFLYAALELCACGSCVMATSLDLHENKQELLSAA